MEKLDQKIPNYGERFWIPSSHYEKDFEWESILEFAISESLQKLKLSPELKLNMVIDTCVGMIQPKLIAKNGDHHARNFGELRSYGTMRRVALGGVYQESRSIAITSLENNIDLSLSEEGFVVRAKKHFYNFQGKEIKLSILKSIDSQKVKYLSIQVPHENINEIVQVAIESLFEGLKNQINKPKNIEKTEYIIDNAIEIYWLMSQAMLYERGSACIADITLKLIMDYFGIYIPNWKPEINPNIIAMILTLDNFKKEFPNFLTEDIRWY
jgi:Avirulence protein